MIEFKNVSFSYKKGNGIKNINFKIQESDFVFLIGPTGSGKTTLMKLIYGEIFANSGDIILDDLYLNSLKNNKVHLLRRKIGMVFQNYELLEDRNVFNNIAFPLHILGYNASEIPERVDEALSLVGLTDKKKSFTNELSGGEQQRVSLARAIIKEPDVLLADEPTGNLDPVASFELMKLLEKVNDTGTTILMTSHNYSLIKGRGRRIIELKNGELRGD